jgi:hypothetical protein
MFLTPSYELNKYLRQETTEQIKPTKEGAKKICQSFRSEILENYLDPPKSLINYPKFS